MPTASCQRYAIYWTPAPGPLADFGAAWLGWDPGAGTPVDTPDIAGLPVDRITATPRKYGLHATMKAPFRLSDGKTPQDLRRALDIFAAARAPVMLSALALARLGDFLCLRPKGGTAPLNALAAATVRDLDHFRAPLTDADIARRRRAGLTPEADALLLRWGYPHVMQRFRFHVTLTDPLDDAMADRCETALAAMLAPLLPRPFAIDALTLMGEADDGQFHTVHRAPLTGVSSG